MSALSVKLIRLGREPLAKLAHLQHVIVTDGTGGAHVRLIVFDVR